jgi:hypothetical protein
MASKLYKEVEQRAGFCCEYCKAFAAFSPTPFVLEHIIPFSKSGLTTFLNLALACQGCNNYKYNFISAKDPISGLIVSIFNPRLDDWNTHFFWNEDFTLILGETAIGRATIARLKLNRPELLNIRRVLFLMGEHPSK